MSSSNLQDAMIYGTISVTIVSMLSLVGAFLAPLLRSENKNRWLHFFLAMAVSTLSTDAILHIIPQILSSGGGGHGHSHGGGGGHAHSHSHAHSHEHEHHENSTMDEHDEEGVLQWHTLTNERKTLLHLSVIVITIYLLYLIEFVLLYRKQMSDEKRKSEIEACECATDQRATDSEGDSDSRLNNNNLEKNRQEVEEEESARERSGHELVNLNENHDEDGSRLCGLKPRAFIILFGDAVHNLVDGIAIGTSFLVSWKLGIITSVAVVCHELPHEIGDLAVLVDSGLSMIKALFLNLLSALTAYIGLFISILLGRNDEIEVILLSITAGMFLYVAWVDMLSHLKHEAKLKDNWIVTCILQFFGFASGFLLIFALGWFE